MGWWSDFSGQTAANASRAAAADQYGKQQSAIGRLLGYGDEYKTGQDAIGASYQPYVDSANRISGASNDALYNLIQNPESVRSLPGYQFAQDQGVQALDRGAAARHMLNSGRGSKDLLRFGTGLADSTYGSQLSRLMGLDKLGFDEGMSATGAGNAARSAGLQGQFGARQSAYNGDMTSAGTIGQGDIAAATAKGKGAQNIFDGAMKIGGMALGAFGVPSMPSWMGGGGSSMSGGSGNYDPNTNLPLYSSDRRPLWAS